MNKLSVIIPTYNESRDLPSCLDSLDKQKSVKFEVIVVDDGSKDDTQKILKRYKPKKYSLKILKENHKGAGAARNKGALKAKGNILVFVDADMTFDPHFLQKLTNPITKGETKGTFSKEEFVSNWDNVWARCWSINENWEGGKRHPKDYPDEQKVFRAIKKSEFDRVNGFTPGGYTDDWSLHKKLGYKATNSPGAIFHHRNPSSLAEIFSHAQWVGKRKYKFWVIGAKIALLRASLPFTLLVGVYKSIKFKTAAFIVFKLVYNTGLTIGILKYIFWGGGEK